MSVKKKTELEQLITDIHSHNLNYHTRSIYLHSFYSDDDLEEGGVEFKMATMFIKNLHLLLNQNPELPIIVHMHSLGGSWNDGMAIFNSIRFSTAPITILGYAQTSSMSGVILQAADRRVLMPDCEVMIHHGSVALDNNSMAAKSVIDANERCCRRMLDIFAKRAKTGKFFKERAYAESKVKAYLDRKIKDKSDWFLSAQEAHHYGICDAIMGEAGCETMAELPVLQKYKYKI